MTLLEQAVKIIDDGQQSLEGWIATLSPGEQETLKTEVITEWNKIKSFLDIFSDFLSLTKVIRK